MTTDDAMITYRIGRFMIQVLETMKVAHRSARMRFRDVQDILVKNPKDRPKERIAAYENIWGQRLGEIQKKVAPHGKTQVIINTRTLDQGDIWTRAVAYYGNTDIPKMAYWDIFSASGDHGLWLSWNGKESALERMLDISLDIARAYHPLDPTVVSPPKEGGFYLEHGFIALPYFEQEEAYARFEGHPLGLKLRIQTNETHEDEAPDVGLLGRLAAALGSGLASGVELDKIRTAKREIGGLKGEETVLRAKTKTQTDLSFLWRYAGKKDSGDHPKIVIEIEAKDGQLEEKLKVWDALLDSFKPVGQ